MGRARELAEVATAYVGGGLNFRNRIINGDMRIDQRNNGAAVTLNEYPVDRFRSFVIFLDELSLSLQQDNSAPTGFVKSIKTTINTPETVFTDTEEAAIVQYIEGNNIADLSFGTASASPVTLSFWVRSSLTGTFGGSLQNQGNNRSYPFSYTISSANTWEKKTITVAGDTAGTWVTDAGIGMRVFWSLGAGPDKLGAAGAWTSSNHRGVIGQVQLATTNGATFYITGVQLEAGSVATPFERRPYTTEEQLCQRYGFDPLGARGGNFGNLGAGMARGSSNAQLFIRPPVTLRTGSPSVTWSGNFNAVYGSGSATAVTSISIDTAATSASAVALGVNISSGFTAGQMMFVETANNQTAKAFISTEL